MSQTALVEAVCDAVFLLGFGKATPEPSPKTQPGEIILQYGGWSLSDLGSVKQLAGLIGDFSHCLQYTERIPRKGSYTLRVNPWQIDSQAPEKPAWPGANTVLVASLLLANFLATGERLWSEKYLFCGESADRGVIGLFWKTNGSLDFHFCDTQKQATDYWVEAKPL